MQLKFVKSDGMIADLLTKALPSPRILVLRGLFNLKSIQDEVEESYMKLSFMTGRQGLEVAVQHLLQVRCDLT